MEKEILLTSKGVDRFTRGKLGHQVETERGMSTMVAQQWVDQDSRAEFVVNVETDREMSLPTSAELGNEVETEKEMSL